MRLLFLLLPSTVAWNAWHGDDVLQMMMRLTRTTAARRACLFPMMPGCVAAVVASPFMPSIGRRSRWLGWPVVVFELGLADLASSFHVASKKYRSACSESQQPCMPGTARGACTACAWPFFKAWTGRLAGGCRRAYIDLDLVAS